MGSAERFTEAWLRALTVRRTGWVPSSALTLRWMVAARAGDAVARGMSRKASERKRMNGTSSRIGPPLVPARREEGGSPEAFRLPEASEKLLDCEIEEPSAG
jgi:hypothetical protein